MAIEQGNACELDIVEMEELKPVFLFAVDGSVSGGCEGGSEGWKCDVRATENT